MTGRSSEQRDGILDAAEAWERLRGIRSEADAEAAGLIRGTDGRRRWGCASPDADILADRYLPLCLGGPRFAIAQLGQSLDGFIASRTGDADYVTGTEDRDHLHRLRALCDAVVIGAGTAVADDPQLTVRTCAGSNPVRVVLDPHRRVPLRHRVFSDGAAPTLWVVGADKDRGQAVPAMDGIDILPLPDAAAFALDVCCGNSHAVGWAACLSRVAESPCRASSTRGRCTASTSQWHRSCSVTASRGSASPARS